MNVLVVDDDLTSRTILGAILKKLGHKVLTARNGAEALTALENTAISLVISDMVMPEVDGLELCRRVRAGHRSEYTYIILLTSLGGKYGQLVGMRAGADDFLAKPCNEEMLSARLRVAEHILSLQSKVKQLAADAAECPRGKRIGQQHESWASLQPLI